MPVELRGTHASVRPTIAVVASRASAMITKNPGQPAHEEGLCCHTFAASTAMIGVCLTVLRRVQRIGAMKRVSTVADDMLAASSLLFVACCLASYWVLRAGRSQRRRRLERIADILFMIAVVLSVLAGGIL